MADITYTPQFQPPAWRDNVDLIAAEGPRGFNAQFQSLQTELVRLSGIVKQLSDAILSVNQTAQTTGSTIQTLQSASRVVQAARWGNILADGTIASGSGTFTVTKAGTGLYDIFFNPAFAAIPIVTAVQIYPWGDGGAPPAPPNIRPTGGITSAGMMTTDNVVVIGITLSQCRIKTGDGTGAAADRPFSFLAYGPST